MKSENLKQLIHWAPRVGLILFALFLVFLSLENGWAIPGAALIDNIKLFIQNNTLAIAILLILAIGWRLEHVGAVFITVFSIIYTVYYTMTVPGKPLTLILQMSPVLVPSLIITILFLFAYTQKVYARMDEEEK